GNATLGSSLFLHGPTGVGKTHLLHAVFHALHGSGTIVACLPAAQLVSALVAAYGRHGHEAFWRDLAPLGALLLDDVHSFAGQEELQERLMEGLVAHARLSGRPLDEALAEEVLPELRVAPPLSVDRIVEATAGAFGCSARLLRGRSRRAELVLPRQVAMYLARKLLARPFAELAAQFTRDHTTVLHAWRTIRTRL